VHPPESRIGGIPITSTRSEARVFSVVIIIDAVITGHVIASFHDDATEDIFHGANSPAARRACPQTLWPIARRRLDQINRVRQVRELSIPPGNRLERLKGDRNGQYSIRINEQYRICLNWHLGNAYDVEITDYH
jgi:proteic killer suppression protein